MTICALTKGALLAIVAACVAAALQTVAPMKSPLDMPPMWFAAHASAPLQFLASLLPVLPFCILYGIVTGSIIDDRTRGWFFKAFTMVAFTVVLGGGLTLVSSSLGCYVAVVCIAHVTATWIWA